MPSRLRPRIRPAAHTSSRHPMRSCSVPQDDDRFFPAQPALCPPPRHRGRGDGLLTSPIIAARLPLQPQAHESLPSQRAPLARAQASRTFTGIPPSKVLCRCVAPVLLLSLLHSAAAALMPSLVPPRSCNRSLHTAAWPAGQRAGSVRIADFY